MNRRAHWLLAAVMAAVCAWTVWALQQPELVHQLALLMPLC